MRRSPLLETFQIISLIADGGTAHSPLSGYMDIKQATAAYETWLGRKIPLIEADLKLKHLRMTESPFQFLRATFYHWSQL